MYARRLTGIMTGCIVCHLLPHAQFTLMYSNVTTQRLGKYPLDENSSALQARDAVKAQLPLSASS